MLCFKKIYCILELLGLNGCQRIWKHLEQSNYLSWRVTVLQNKINHPYDNIQKIMTNLALISLTVVYSVFIWVQDELYLHIQVQLAAIWNSEMKTNCLPQKYILGKYVSVSCGISKNSHIHTVSHSARDINLL